MNDYLSIFQGILSTEGTFMDIFLDGLDEHGQFDIQNDNETDVVQHITSLLTTASTRFLGLRLLDKFIDNCANDVLESKGSLWTTLVLKACNDKEMIYDSYIAFHVLNKIVKSSQQIPDFAKSFVSSHISKVYENLTNLPESKLKYVLSCIETCLLTYPGSSGPSRGLIERFLWKNVDHIDFEVVQVYGKCFHLLQQVKGGGIQGVNHKTQWKNYQIQLLGGIHSVYNMLFANCVEIYDDKIEQEKLPWDSELIDFDTEPVKRAGQMYNRCRNLVTYLTIALREPFPVEKPILAKKILNVIIRGLSVNCLMLERNTNADNIALSILLPKLHIDLLNLLDVFITVLRGHVRPYSELILGLIVDEIKWTSGKNVRREQKKFWSLREKIYDAVSLWCKIFNGGNCCETIAECLLQEILIDITPKQNEFTLKVLSGARKHMSKKARRQLQNSQNEKSNIAKAACGNNDRKQYISETKKQKMCISALRCFQEIIFSVANFLKPTLLKMVQTNVIQICAIFHELAQNPPDLYSNKNCRIEIYNALYAILITTHHLCPPPTELILAIIQTAYARDKSLKVRVRCGFILKSLEKIIHPQKESLLFSIEARDIRNTFIKLGQENLLREFEWTLSNSTSNDNGIVEDETPEPLTNNEISDMEYENQTHTNNKSIFENSEVPNKHIGADLNVTESQVIDIINVVTIRGEVDDERLYGKSTDKNIEISKSPELRLCVEDDVDTAIENEENSDETSIYNIGEPMIKKQKLGHEHNDTNETENINMINNMDHDEDKILAEIASQFIDELD